ncbi:hypothetical protein M569_09498 [Genlisea aurea]|uniref:Reverse transcriptase Ty1/copia-type domain-containing protein n=1 Tax=Genlisea aurea TaxID=192259 RepID=S8CEJ5_9LAMI|nr:hypothetical protein M569_09498 [Genlisea aurea]
MDQMMHDATQIPRGQTRSKAIRGNALNLVRDDDMVYAYHVIDKEIPKSYIQAMKSPERSQWEKAIEKELHAIKEAGTFKLILRAEAPVNARIFKPVWTFRIKHDGRFKARLCFPDDILLAGSQSKIEEITSLLKIHFTITDLGPISRYIGVNCIKTSEGFELSQEEEIHKALTKFNLADAHPISYPISPSLRFENESPPFEQNQLYHSAVGTLMLDFILSWFSYLLDLETSNSNCAVDYRGRINVIVCRSTGDDDFDKFTTVFPSREGVGDTSSRTSHDMHDTSSRPMGPPNWRS